MAFVPVSMMLPVWNMIKSHLKGRNTKAMPIFEHFDKYLMRGYTNASGVLIPPKWVLRCGLCMEKFLRGGQEPLTSWRPGIGACKPSFAGPIQTWIHLSKPCVKNGFLSRPTSRSDLPSYLSLKLARSLCWRGRRESRGWGLTMLNTTLLILDF